MTRRQVKHESRSSGTSFSFTLSIICQQERRFNVEKLLYGGRESTPCRLFLSNDYELRERNQETCSMKTKESKRLMKALREKVRKDNEKSACRFKAKAEVKNGLIEEEDWP
jgi:hypothetical protein